MTAATAPTTGTTGVLGRIGVPRALALGFVGLALFMIGDGVESNYLAPYLAGLPDFGSGTAAQTAASRVILFYGIFAAVGAWLSGVLSSLFGPRRVMVAGLSLWALFEVLFLSIALPTGSMVAIYLTYGVRGVAFPLFAFSFLVWINRATSRENRGSASGVFWLAYTGGLPVLGTAVAFFAIPAIGEYATFWLSLALVVLGGLIAVLGAREAHGLQTRRETDGGEDVTTGRELTDGVTILWRNPKIGRAAITRIINTGAQYGFFVALPFFLQKTIGFSQQEYLAITVITFGANVVANPITGRLSDRVGWRRMIMWVGSIGCTVTTVLLYLVPLAVRENFLVVALIGALYGVTLAGFVPLSALMPSMVRAEEQGNAIAVYALSAGLSTVLGPLVYSLLFPILGLAGVMFTFAGLYAVSAILAFTLRDPSDPGERRRAGAPVTAHP